MVEKTDFIDITPEQVGGPGAGGRKQAVFQEDEWNHILFNPGGLTKEGVLAKLVLWKKSSNRQVVLKYETMLARCKEFKASGKTPDGKIVLSRLDDGTPKWVEDDPNYVPPKSKEPKEKDKEIGDKNFK